MKKTTFSHSLLSLCLLFLISILGGGNAVNAQTTVTKTSFTDGEQTGASLDKVVSYTTATGDSQTQPGIYSGELRLYQPSSGKNYGNSIKIAVVDGYSLVSVSITTSQATAYSYTLDERTEHSAKTSLAANATATVDGLSNKSITFYCMGSSKKNRLNISSIAVTYVSTATGSTDPKLSYNRASDVVLSSNIAGWSAPALTSEVIGDLSTLSFTYSSNKESVATVTSAGEISLTGTAGEAVISAKFDGDATYAAQTPTYKVNVFDPVTLDKEAGTYDNEVTVTLSAAGAQGIVYTTDGTEPTLNNGTKVEATSKELTFNATTTLKAISYYGETLSDVASAVYTIQKVLAVPTITPEGGTFNYEKKVTIASPGVAAIVYTLDGADPKDLGAGAEVIDGDSKEITITSSCTLKARTSDANLEQFSDGLATADFIINLPQPVIKLSAESTQEQSITVTIEAEGASHIYYSTDGTDPTATSNSVVKVGAATTEFTLSEIGSYEIKAIALNSALDASDAATRTCTIRKVVPVPGSATMKYKKVTSEEDIVDGGVYILVCETGSGAMSKIESDKGTVVAITQTDNTYDGKANGSDLPYEFKLEAQEDGTYALYSYQGGYICSAGGTDNKLILNAEKDANAYWNISLTQGYYNVTIESTTTKTSSTGTTYKVIRYNPNKNNGSPLFRLYSSSYGNTIQLYKKTFDLSVNANTAGYATAYTTFPYVMPASADGYIVTETAEGETIKAKNKYPAGTEVPAYAPLLIKNSEPGVKLNPVVLGKTVEAYNYVASNPEAVEAGNVNLLYGTRLESDGVTTDVDGTDNYYYYKLSYKLDAEKNPVADSYGFYRGKADGSAFEMKNTLTAYLALPKSSGLVNNLRISIDNEEGTTTGIQANRIPADNMPQSIYTLSGVRVNAAGGSLPKGIYIVNGKKVVIK